MYSINILINIQNKKYKIMKKRRNQTRTENKREQRCETRQKAQSIKDERSQNGSRTKSTVNNTTG